MTASKTLRNSVAALIVGLAATALALMLWTGQRALALEVPITLSLAVDDTVWVSSPGVLHELGAAGQRVNRLSLESLGLPRPVLHLHAVRRDDLLVSAGEPMRVYRCSPSQRACRLVDAGYIERYGKFKNAVWLGANADGSRIVVSDNAAHRMAVLDGANGALLAAAGGSVGRFHYPGQPVWVGEKTIWLASADHHRVERFEVDGSAIGEPSQTIRLTKGEVALDGRTWPMALAPTGDGQWWALVKVNMMTDGGLVRIDAEGRFTTSAQLPRGADLTAVTRLGDHLIATDLTGPALLRLSLDGADATPFGSDEFQAELAAHAPEVVQWYRWQEWAKWALIGAPIAGIGLLLLLGEKAGRPSAAIRAHVLRNMAAVAAPADEVVIAVTNRFRKTMRAMLWLLLPQLFAFPIAFLAWLLFKTHVDDWVQPATLRAMATLFVMTWSTGLLLVWAVRRIVSLRLRVADGHIRCERDSAEVANLRLADCHTDGRALLMGATMLRVRQPFLPLFDPDLMQRHVFAQMPESQWLTPSRLQRRWLMVNWQKGIDKLRSLFGN